MTTLTRFLALAALHALTVFAVRAQVPDAKAPATQPAPEKQPAPAPPGFALIPAGEFVMGDALDGIKAAPQHKVNVSAFFMQKNLVTKAQWDEVRVWAMKHGYSDLPVGEGKAPNHPVFGVSWYAAVKWCNARSEKEGLVPCYHTDSAKTEAYRSGDKDIANEMVKWDASGYRLPTEAEWEKAARGGLVGKRFPWGDTISHREANFCNGIKQDYETGSAGFHPTYKTGEWPYTSPVGSFPANGYDLHDMVGNAFEWCWDRLDVYPDAVETDPRGPDKGSGRVRRGGCWALFGSGCRVALRKGEGTDFFINANGFRPVRSAVP